MRLIHKEADTLANLCYFRGSGVLTAVKFTWGRMKLSKKLKTLLASQVLLGPFAIFGTINIW